MKKAILSGVVVLVLGAGAALWRFGWLTWGGSETASGPVAIMRDESTPRKMEPSLVVLVNEAEHATVAGGTPVWITVGVSNRAAANEVAAGRGGAGSERPGAIKLGDAQHPWSGAVRIQVLDARGAQAAGLSLHRLGQEESIVKIDAANSADVTFGAASVEAAAGTYSVTACLGAIGEWKGEVCSAPAQLTVVARGEATPQQGARFALLAGDAAGMEAYGRKLIDAERDSISGLVYMAESSFRRGNWAEALERFQAARAAHARRKAAGAEPPLFILARMRQIRSKL